MIHDASIGHGDECGDDDGDDCGDGKDDCFNALTGSSPAPKASWQLGHVD